MCSHAFSYNNKYSYLYKCGIWTVFYTFNRAGAVAHPSWMSAQPPLQDEVAAKGACGKRRPGFPVSLHFVMIEVL